MENINILPTIIGIVISVMGYFLKKTMDKLDAVEKQGIENKAKIDIVDNNHTHLSEKVDKLYDAIKDLTVEIKNLSKEISSKKMGNIK